MSKRITVSLEEEHEEIVGEVLQEDGVDSQAEAVRRCLTRARDLAKELVDVQEAHQERITEMQERIDELETEVKRQENARRKLIEQREEHDDLVRYVDDEMNRRERRRRAPAWTRAKWWLFGESDEK